MKIVFLDIDGVLNCKQTPNPRKFPFIVDGALLGRLERLLEITGAEVVLDSNWRYDPVGLLAAKHFRVPFVDTTPDLPGQPRCTPILEWLHQHPDVERFIVIDDEDDELDDLPLFQPLRREGLSDEIVTTAADYLNGKTDQDMRRNKLVRIFQNLSALCRGHKN
jgi:HAD domain in Swiss Army Knife RNA repair proteins